MATTASLESKSALSVFWRFWFATTVSDVGSAVTTVALPLVALTVLDASAFQVTFLAAASQVAWLVLGLPAGVIVQRFPLRGLQVLLDLTRMVAIGSIPVAWWLGHLTYTHLLLSALVMGSAKVLFDIGSATFLPAIIDKKELSARNSLISGTNAVTQTGGPSVSGLLIQVAGPVGVLIVDAVSYLISALTLRTLPEHRSEPQQQARMAQMVREGWSFVVRHPVMRPCMMWATAMNFVSAALMALAPLYLVREAGVSSFVVGVVIAMNGVGALIGSTVATRLSVRFGTARAVIVANFVGGFFALVIPLTTALDNVYFFALGNVGFSFGVVVGSIMIRTHRQIESPPELLSRVIATVRFVSWGALPLGALLSGVLATGLGLRAALWIVCAGAFLTPLVLVLSPVRRRRDLESPREAEAEM